MQGAEFEQVYDFGNLYAGFLKARRGKRHKPSVAKFEANLLEALCLLSEMLKTKTYRPSDYFVFKVYEPKERIVMTNAFKDKVVQHSLCDNILEPAFSKAFIRSYYFTRKANAERERRAAGLPPPGPEEVRHYSDGWVLKCDISKYFYSIQHEPLKQMTRKYIKDPDILWLVDLIVDSTENPGIPIFPLRNGIDFLGFHTYLTESGKIIRKVRRSSKCNAQRKLKKQRGLLDREKISLSDIEQSYGSWRSHAAKGNCYHLIQKTDSLFQNLFKESEKQWPKV